MRKLSMILLLCWTANALGAEAMPSKAALLAALMGAEVTDPDRQLTHLSHVCTLLLDGQRLPVLDVREIVPGVPSPRGVNAIVILDHQLRVRRAVGYDDQRPLYCIDNRLLLYGELSVDNVGAAGNVLTVQDAGERIDVSSLEAAEWPVAPIEQFEW
jgi:hypothetical protein